MQTLRQTLQIFLPLVLGIGLLVGLSGIPALVQFEHALFWKPSNFVGSPHFMEPGRKEDFEIKIFQQTIVPLVRTNTTYRIDSKTEDILGNSPLDPSNWAYFLSQLTPEKSDLLLITDELSWSDAEEIPILALQHQISRFPASVIGLDCEKTANKEAIPPYLQGSVIAKYDGYPTDLEQIDHVTAPPSVQPTYFGIASIRGLNIEQGETSIKVPLLVRWDDQILPSVELAALLASFRIKPAELVIDRAGYLRLDRDGPIFLPIDKQGFTEVHSTGNPVASASEFLISPRDFGGRFIVIAGEDAPVRLRHLAGTFNEAAMFGQALGTTIRRWPLIIETSFLILLVISFTTYRLFPALLLIAIGYLVTTFCTSQWFILSPAIALLIFYFIFFGRPPSRPGIILEKELQKKPDPNPSVFVAKAASGEIEKSAPGTGPEVRKEAKPQSQKRGSRKSGEKRRR